MGGGRYRRLPDTRWSRQKLAGTVDPQAFGATASLGGPRPRSCSALVGGDEQDGPPSGEFLVDNGASADRGWCPVTFKPRRVFIDDPELLADGGR